MRYFKSGEVIPCSVVHIGSISPMSFVEVFYGGNECFVASFECDAKHFSIRFQNYSTPRESFLCLLPTEDTDYSVYSDKNSVPPIKKTVLSVGDDSTSEYEIAQAWNEKWDVKVLFVRRVI